MIGNKKIVHFLSASDRINYGDLLFPIIFKKVAEKFKIEIDFYNYGIIKSDLSHFGALKTLSYKKFQKNVNKLGGTVVIGGGEVFFASWTTLYSFINKTFSNLLSNNYFKSFENKFHLSRRLLTYKEIKVPFCIAKEELQNKKVKIFYSSVGGGLLSSSSKLKSHITKAISDSSLLSVRDDRTQYNLEKVNINSSKIVPDSALTMSDFFTNEILTEKSTISEKMHSKDFIFLQIGRFKRPNDLKKFSEDVKNLSSKLNLEVILCPIGKAARHEDDIVLKEICSFEKSFHYIDPKNIYDIMFLISISKIYIGTSLHGMITAQSFNVPFVGLNRKIEKLEGYIKYWIDENYENIDFEELHKVESIFKNWDFQKLNVLTNNQKEMVYANLFKILNDNE